MRATFAHSAFSALMPATVLTTLSPGTETLGICLHTPDKGWWNRSVAVNLAPAREPADEPINFFLHPLDNTTISQKQKFDKFSLYGYALDRTPLTDPGNQTLSSCECGESSVTTYVDSIDCEHNLGNASQSVLIAFANRGEPRWQSIDDFSPVSRGSAPHRVCRAPFHLAAYAARSVISIRAEAETFELIPIERNHAKQGKAITQSLFRCYTRETHNAENERDPLRTRHAERLVHCAPSARAKRAPAASEPGIVTGRLTNYQQLVNIKVGGDTQA
jgi:hypothetical protein